jgi:predicted nucleic acid-binding protein
MPAKYAIIDTSVLISLYSLGLLEYLNVLYLNVRVPREVEREFLEKNRDLMEQTQRFIFLDSFYQKHGSWFSQCNEYGSDLIEIYLTEKGLDRGEAEVFAQNQVLNNNHDLLLDERDGRRVAKDKNIKHHGVLYILARLELNFRVCNYFEKVKQLQINRIGNISNKIAIEVFEIVKADFS